jgi:tetratricopeptide (TPR) repeat protein
MRRLFYILPQIAICILVLMLAAGCATYPPSDQRVSFLQCQRFNPDNPPEKTKDALSAGNQYRQLVAEHLSDKTAQGKANVYWYTEEGLKFYKYVSEELEPRNAYAAVCVGQMYIMRARLAPEKNGSEQLSLADKWLAKANEEKSGYVEMHRSLGEMYAGKEEWRKAEAEFAKLVDSGFEDSHIYAWLGYILKKQKKVSEAKMFLEKAVEYGFPEDCSLWAGKQM